MKLICVEEHVLDPAIGAATQALVLAQAPYLPGWGSRVIDGQRVADTRRPHVVAPQESARKALDMGAARLADMDAGGIDVQVLSYGGFAQMLPAAESIELNRAANDRLAAATQLHPTRFAAFATLPWQAPEAAARELERTVKQLGSMPHFQFVHTLMGSERILYSIDYPYQSLDGARAFLSALAVSDAERSLIAHGNADRLLRL
jgi:predicted TIM-barrel fold metal-dependent hydrolase